MQSRADLLSGCLSAMLAGSVSGLAIGMFDEAAPTLKAACRALLDTSIHAVSGVSIGDASLPYVGQARPMIDVDMREWVHGVDYTRDERPLNLVSCSAVLWPCALPPPLTRLH
jgi:hypothetical protein